MPVSDAQAFLSGIASLAMTCPREGFFIAVFAIMDSLSYFENRSLDDTGVHMQQKKSLFL
jgi:hypothetical protein